VATAAATRTKRAKLLKPIGTSGKRIIGPFLSPARQLKSPTLSFPVEHGIIGTVESKGAHRGPTVIHKAGEPRASDKSTRFDVAQKCRSAFSAQILRSRPNCDLNGENSMIFAF